MVGAMNHVQIAPLAGREIPEEWRRNQLATMGCSRSTVCLKRATAAVSSPPDAGSGFCGVGALGFIRRDFKIRRSTIAQAAP